MLNNRTEIHTIVTDLDGTLLKKDGTISHLNARALQTALDSGLTVILATGRRFYSTFKLASYFSGVIPLICNNGQILRMYPSKEKIWQKYLEPNFVLQVLGYGKESGFQFLMHTDRYEEGVDFITEHPPHQIHKDYSNGGERSLWYESIKSSDVLFNITVLCFFNSSREKLEKFGNFLLEKYPESGIRTVITHIYTIGPCLEIIHLDSSKWAGVEEILKRKNLDSRGVIAFGDEANDMEMIQESGIGVALSNSIDEIKKIADFISPYSHMEDAVGKTLLELNVIKLLET